MFQFVFLGIAEKYIKIRKKCFEYAGNQKVFTSNVG